MTLTTKVQLFEHPEYKEKRDFYESAEDTYEGDQECLKDPKYLWLHELETRKEGANIRKIRQQRSAYTNFIEPIVSNWTSMFFKKEPTMDEATKAFLKEFENDIDGEGNSLNSFIQNKLLISALVSGTPIIRANVLGEKPGNLAEQQLKTNYRPYLKVIEACDFVDWGIERKDPKRLNKFNFVRLQYEEMQDRLDAEQAPKEKEISIQYKIVTNEGQNPYLVVTEYEKVEDKEGDKEKVWKITKVTELKEWDEIPIVADVNGVSWIKDLIPHVLKYYNLESALDNICLYQAHQRLFLAGELEQKDMITISECAISSVPTGTTLLTVEPVSTTAIEGRLGSVLNNIFRIALNQSRMMSSDAKSVQGADTIRQEKEGIYNLISAEAESIENLVNQSIKMMAKYLGNDSLEPQFKFNIDASGDNVDQLIKLVSLFRDEFNKLPSARKELISNMLSSLNIEVSNDIAAEIETLIKQPSANLEVNIKDRLLNGLNNKQPTSEAPAGSAGTRSGNSSSS